MNQRHEISLNLWLTEYYLQRVHVIHWLDCGVGCIPDYNQNYNKQGYALRKKFGEPKTLTL